VWHTSPIGSVYHPIRISCDDDGKILILGRDGDIMWVMCRMKQNAMMSR
jgi:hypothetical protein